MKFAAVAALIASASALDVCCNKCADDEIKTYSIDHIFNMCGESCIKEADFWKYKIFEPGMHKADAIDQKVCEGLGYEYNNTDEHGIHGVFSVVVDLYKPVKAGEIPEAAFKQDEYLFRGFSEEF